MIACKAAKGPASAGWWRWREVDGKTCWHVSRQRLDKSQLYWERPSAPSVVETAVEARADVKVWAEPPPDARTRVSVAFGDIARDDEVPRVVSRVILPAPVQAIPRVEQPAAPAAPAPMSPFARTLAVELSVLLVVAVMAGAFWRWRRGAPQALPKKRAPSMGLSPGRNH